MAAAGKAPEPCRDVGCSRHQPLEDPSARPQADLKWSSRPVVRFPAPAAPKALRAFSPRTAVASDAPRVPPWTGNASWTQCGQCTWSANHVALQPRGVLESAAVQGQAAFAPVV